MEYSVDAAVLDGWNVTRLLGEGSYGKVFEIERSEFGQTYRAALKVITVPQSSAEVRSVISEGMSVSQAEAYFHGIVEELMHEFSIMFKLKGTANVVSCEDLRVLEHPDGIGWDILIRMELLHPLLPYVYQHPMARRDIIRLGIDICKALELCQRYNIIHRDIKPENIFISDNGDYKLGDFGIARTIERTTSGLSQKGTYSYMAPEVYAGREYGFSVDTYSLGLVLYRMLNKNRGPFLPQPPEAITFSSREQALARRMSSEPLPRPFYGEGRLGEIVLKACAFDPKDRYSSPQQFRQELEAILYTQTDAAVIYPDGDELTIDREPYASVRRPAAPGQAEPKPMDATQGVFTDTPRTESEPTAEDRTRPAFDAEKPKRTSTKKKRKRRRGLRIAAGIAGGAAALVVLAVAVTALLHWRGAPIPAFLDRPIAAVLGKYAVPKALWEYEEAGTLERNYEKGMMTGYKTSAYNKVGALEEVTTFSTAGNEMRCDYYDANGDVSWICLYKYRSDGTLEREEGYDGFSNLMQVVEEYDSAGNMVRYENYDENGGLSYYYLSEYDSNGNEIKAEFYEGDGKLESAYTSEYDANGNIIKQDRRDSNGELTDYWLYTYNADGQKIREESYDETGKRWEYTQYLYDDTGKRIKEENYGYDSTLQSYRLYIYDADGAEIRYENYDSDGTMICYWSEDDDGYMREYNPDGTLVYDEVTSQTDSGVANETREDYYDENGELRQYALFQYDEEGNVIEVRRYDKADTLVWSSMYSYNSEGNLAECTVYDKFDNFLLRLTYRYDVSGKLIKQTSDTGDGSLLYFQCEYDDAGNMSKEEVGGSNLGVYGRYQCSYDGTGNMTKMEYYNESELTGEKGLAGYYIYSFDAAGNRVRKEHYNGDGKLLGYTVNEFDQQGNTVTSKVYNADGTLSANSLYKYGDHCTVEYQYGQNGGLLAYRIYEYDAVGNVVWEETYNQNDELIEYSLYEFEAVGETTRYVYNLDDGSLNYFTGEDGDEAYLIRRVR